MQNGFDDPHLSRLTGFARDFCLYNGLLARRISSHGLLCAGKIQASALRLLMRRGGFFAPAPRLGLTALSGSLVFSLVLMPVVGHEAGETQAGFALGADDSRVLGALSAQASETTAGLSSEDTEGSALEGSDSQPFEYTVQSGDTLFSIGQTYGVSVESLAYTNNLSDEDFLSVGQVLTIPPRNGLVHTVKPSENVSLIAEKYGVSAQAIVDFNLLSAPYLLHAGDELVIPEVKRIPLLPATNTGAGLALQPLPGAGLPAQAGKLGHPLPGATVTQFFSSFHPAADFSTNSCGTPVVASAGGQVYFASWWVGGGGNTVMIDHGGGVVTKYAHLQGFARGAGPVSQGEVIGFVGATGRAFGCHLHFIVQRGGQFVNPLGEL